MGLILQTCNIDESVEKIFDLLWLIYEKEMKKLNFTSIKGKHEFYIKHFVDSIVSVEENKLIEDGDRVLDIGTGGGFPGVPLSIIYKKSNFILLDSVKKKMDMIGMIKNELNLKNVELIVDRAEEVAHLISHRERYDVVVNRALAKWSSLLELSVPYLKIGGKLIAYKAKESAEDLAEADAIAELLGAKMDKVYYYELPDKMGERCLVTFVKEKSTEDIYPRNPGLIKKRPLCLK